jgi:hypothetical protein
MCDCLWCVILSRVDGEGSQDATEWGGAKPLCWVAGDARTEICFALLPGPAVSGPGSVWSFFSVTGSTLLVRRTATMRR